MGFKKEAAPVLDKPTLPAADATRPETPKADTQKPEYNADEKRVRGQVRMHALMCGYKVAASLAPTLANTASGIKDELHKLALEVAAKVEEYSFL